MNISTPIIKRLVILEKEAANADHPAFHSLHEGYGVIREEWQESREALKCVKKSLKELWECTREDENNGAMLAAAQIYAAAVQTAAEAIQVAAMADKLMDYIRDLGGRRRENE